MAGGEAEIVRPMLRLPAFLVTLTHATWDAALACAGLLPEQALPELRLDLFPDLDPKALVRDLEGHCLVTCRRVSEGGRWPDADEPARMTRLRGAVEAGAAWMDLEWEVPVPEWIQARRGPLGLLRSVHVAPGIFDLESRLTALPEGDAFKWVGHAASLTDNARTRDFCALAASRGLAASCFLMGPKGIPSRCLQQRWGGAFTYAAPDDGPPAAPGQLTLATMLDWGVDRVGPGTALFAVVGEPVLHSRSPAFHNRRFRDAGRDAVYLPLESSDASEAAEVLELLGIRGLSITAPLKESLPARLGLAGPLNTLWREGGAWQGANTDAEALDAALRDLPAGPVLVLGSGGVAETSRLVVAGQGRVARLTSRREPVTPEEIRALAPVGVIQATSLGMAAGDPRPFPGLLDAARPSLAWAVEWIYKEDTAFAAWVREAGLRLVQGATLFEAQAEAQARRFLAEPGESGLRRGS